MEETLEITSTTDHEHYYSEGKENGDLKDVICTCGHGMQIARTVEVKEGIIQWNK